MTKVIKINDLPLEYVIETLGLEDTVQLFNMIEDLSDIIIILDSSDCDSSGLIATASQCQRLLIDICRIKEQPDE